MQGSQNPNDNTPGPVVAGQTGKSLTLSAVGTPETVGTSATVEKPATAVTSTKSGTQQQQQKGPIRRVNRSGDTHANIEGTPATVRNQPQYQQVECQDSRDVCNSRETSKSWDARKSIGIWKAMQHSRKAKNSMDACSLLKQGHQQPQGSQQQEGWQMQYGLKKSRKSRKVAKIYI
jgi:hypothetical protein